MLKKSVGHLRQTVFPRAAVGFICGRGRDSLLLKGMSKSPLLYVVCIAAGDRKGKTARVKAILQ